MQKIEPVNNNIVVSLIKDREAKTNSGIYLPGDNGASSNRGQVVAVASNVEEIKVGDTVLFKSLSDDVVEVNNEEFVLLPATEVIARIVDVDAIPE